MGTSPVTPVLALAFVRRQGVALEAGRGPVPSLADTIAGAPIRGSWWGHPMSHEIFTMTRAVRDSQQICVCRLVDGKITYVHRRLWPALARLAPRLPRKRLARLREVHTAIGRHAVEERAFPDWIPVALRRRAQRLSEPQAVSALGRWITQQYSRRPQAIKGGLP